ncbi:MAG: hypothetical protein U5N58_06940 [Actinomycetota bacterium]|nr:hypothetical protein [Actinomycetota bacterium]
MPKKTGCPIAVRGKTFDDISQVTDKLRSAGIKNMVIDIGSRDTKEDLLQPDNPAQDCCH